MSPATLRPQGRSRLRFCSDNLKDIMTATSKLDRIRSRVEGLEKPNAKSHFIIATVDMVDDLLITDDLALEVIDKVVRSIVDPNKVTRDILGILDQA